MAKVIVIGNDQRREYELGPINTDRAPSRQHDPDPRPHRLQGARADHPPARRALPVPRSRQPERHVPARRAHRASTSWSTATRSRSARPRLTFQERSAADSLLQKVTIAPSADRGAHPPEDPGAARRRASSCPRRRSSTSRSCAATTRSCASRTSSGARSASRSTSTCCSRRSSRRRSS